MNAALSGVELEDALSIAQRIDLCFQILRSECVFAPLNFKTIGGARNKIRLTNLVIQTLRDYIKITKLWSSSAEAHRLPERTTIFYHQNSFLTCRNRALTFGKVADVVARDRFAYASGSSVLVAGKAHDLQPNADSALLIERLRDCVDKMICQRKKQ